MSESDLLMLNMYRDHAVRQLAYRTRGLHVAIPFSMLKTVRIRVLSKKSEFKEAISAKTNIMVNRVGTCVVCIGRMLLL